MPDATPFTIDPGPPSRTFVDSESVEWTVREIRSHALPAALARLLGSNDRRRAGWLVFESVEGEKRRLSPFPPDWSTVTPFELERWCMRAVRVPPAPARRREDQASSSEASAADSPPSDPPPDRPRAP